MKKKPFSHKKFIFFLKNSDFRAIYLSMPTVIVIYLLANVAYFAVLTPTEILSSNAVAVVSKKIKSF